MNFECCMQLFSFCVCVCVLLGQYKRVIFYFFIDYSVYLKVQSLNHFIFLRFIHADCGI